MTLDDLIKRIPSISVEAICIAQRASDDAAYEIVWVNKAFCEMFATTREAAEGTDPFAIYHWDYSADFKAAMSEMDAAGKTSFMQDTFCLRYDGSAFWGAVSFLRDEDQETGVENIITIVRDIDLLKNREQSAELALIENEHLLAKIEAVQTRLMSAINMSPDPFCIYDARDRLVIWNPAFADNVTPHPDTLKMGMKNQEIIAMSLENGFIDEAVGQEESYLADYLDAWREGKVPHSITRIQGRDYKVIRSQSPNGDRVVLRVDISEQLRQQRELQTYADRLEEANREISQQAMHDELTGLGNRRFLNARLVEMIETRKQTGLEIAALHIDLDRFKQINDTMGHAVGDYVLEQVADILRTRVRSKDVVARIGGDEFIILTLCAPDSDSPEVLADRLIQEICKPIMYEDRPCRIGASVGIARTPMIPADELITCSDIALYKAKTGGRAMKASFDHGDLEALQSNKRLSDDLLRAIEEDEFVPMFQPQVNTDSNEVVAIEVLAYWDHPQRGLIPASEFLSTAMEIHMDGKIDGMVFRKAIAECRAFFSGIQDPPTIGCNVSLSRLTEPGLIDELNALDYHGGLAFELNETILIDDGQAAVLDTLDALKGLGVSIEVDDFGSGRASIVGLRRISPDRLKIDRRLIEPLTGSDSSRRLVSSIVEIGRALGIGVTAEGVETAEHALQLADLGCERGQGAFYAPPGPLKAYEFSEENVTRFAARG
ncbi:MAG: EAL domain-containing protein [Pseudomonadota bacterium]